MTNFNKRGKVKISRQLYYDGNISHLLFKNFLPIKIETDIDGFIIIAGYSNYFEEVKEGFAVPFYEIIFSTNVQGVPEFDKVIKIQ